MQTAAQDTSLPGSPLRLAVVPSRPAGAPSPPPSAAWAPGDFSQVTSECNVTDSLALPVSGRADPELPPRCMMKTESQEKKTKNKKHKSKKCRAARKPQRAVCRGCEGRALGGKREGLGAPNILQIVWVKPLALSRKREGTQPEAVLLRTNAQVLGSWGGQEGNLPRHLEGRKGLSFWFWKEINTPPPFYGPSSTFLGSHPVFWNFRTLPFGNIACGSNSPINMLIMLKRT